MKTTPDALNLRVPTGKTVLLQHLQTLVLRGNPYWIGGVVTISKLPALATKMAGRYPILRDERARAYDRSKGLASAHFVAYPTCDGIAWWVLTSEGRCGLADKKSADAHVAVHALTANGHIVFEDYVLLYAHKKDARTLIDAKTGKEKKVIKDLSTWTWKMTTSAYNQSLASIREEVKALNFGRDDGNVLDGVRGALAFQRRRPLFSGVRSQVLQLHREAESEWGLVRKAWLGRYTILSARFGENAGRLRPLKEITSQHLPKMGRFKVFGERTVADLCRGEVSVDSADNSNLSRV